MTHRRSLAAALYAFTMRAFPPQHRARYGGEMIDAFARGHATRCAAGGRVAGARFTLAACLDALASGLGERRRQRARQATGRRIGLPRGVGRDLRLALRTLAHARGFTAVCVLSLGVGIGAALAILLFMRAVMAPPPGVQADGMVELLIERSVPGSSATRLTDTWSYPDFLDVSGSRIGLDATAWTIDEVMLGIDEASAFQLAAMYVTPNYFRTVGAGLSEGAGFSAVVDPGSPVIIVSEALARRRLDGQALGRTVLIDRVPHVVAGVAVQRFEGHVSPEESPDIHVWIPLARHPRLDDASGESLRHDRGTAWLRVLGRLEAGVTVAQADAAVASVVAGLAAAHPATNAGTAGWVAPYAAMGARLAPDVALVRTMLLGAAGLVLLVVCLNISGMMLVRGAVRERELAVRQAIGASRARLVQYLLSEAVVLALAGGALAAFVLFGGLATLLWWFEESSSRLWPDLPMLANALGLCLLTSLAFGLLPALRFSRPAVVSALKDEAGVGGRRVGRMQRVTAVVQAAIAVPFLIIGGAKLDQVRTTALAHVGFDTETLFALPVDPAAVGHTGDTAAASYLAGVRDNLAQAAGVESVAMADGLPLDFRRRLLRVTWDDGRSGLWAHATRVDPPYLRAMGIGLLEGRGITDADARGTEPVVVISAPLAERVFGGLGVVGQTLAVAREGEEPRPLRIIGVTADAVTSQMGTPRPQMYLSLAQYPADQVTVIARARADELSMVAAFERAVPDLEPAIVRSSLVTGPRLIRRSMDDLFTHFAIAGICAAVLLTLAALGVYGVVGFMVATRQREIGVRIALGASRARVLGAVTADAMRLVVPGAALGLVAGSYWIRVADPAWYSLGGVEPVVYAVAIGVVLGVAALAGLPSARRASTLDPLRAIRSE